MNRGATAAVAVLSLGLLSCAPKVDVAAEEATLRALNDTIMVAENAKDVEKAVSFYAEDAHVEPANMPAVHGQAAMRDLYNQFFGMGVSDITSTVDQLQVAASGDVAYQYGVNKYKMAMPDGSQMDAVGKYALVWKKVNDEWKIALLAFSDDAPPPPMEQTPPPATQP
ncbi:MAG: DUF4440 domain-containing protein [Gemmatimonadetes bacterium]|nr:DUF4440 domain-containing protein [Gemmatimonadota bacterium]